MHNDGPETLYLGGVTVTMATVVGAVVTPWAPAGCVGVDNYTVVIESGDEAPSGNLDEGEDSVGTVTVTMLATEFDQDGCQTLNVPLHFVADSVVPVP